MPLFTNHSRRTIVDKFLVHIIHVKRENDDVVAIYWQPIASHTHDTHRDAMLLLSPTIIQPKHNICYVHILIVNINRRRLSCAAVDECAISRQRCHFAYGPTEIRTRKSYPYSANSFCLCAVYGMRWGLVYESASVIFSQTSLQFHLGLSLQQPMNLINTLSVPRVSCPCVCLCATRMPHIQTAPNAVKWYTCTSGFQPHSNAPSHSAQRPIVIYLQRHQASGN